MALLGAALVMLSACGGGGDSDPTEPVQLVETAPPSAPTATTQPGPDPTETATPEPTSTPDPTATITPSPSPVPPTATPTITPSPTPTPLPTVETPFGDAQSVVDALPNFTLTYSARFDGAGDEDDTVELLIEQFGPESYHLRVSTGDQQTEAWRSGDTIHVLGPGGAIVELPGLVDRNLYAPSSFLVLVPDLASIGVATILDDNADINGRQATHYEIDPGAASAFRPSDSDPGDEVDGTFEVWVDHELNVVVQIIADVEWTLSGGTQSMQMRYLISEIGTTPEIQQPGS